MGNRFRFRNRFVGGLGGPFLGTDINSFQYDIDFVAGTAKGGFQTYGNNTDDGRMLRDPNNANTTFCPTTPGGALLSSVASAGLRRNSAGNYCYAGTTGLADFLWNRDFTQTPWVKVNMTAAKNQTGADGAANGASSLTASAANGTVLQQTTNASSQMFFTCRAKRLVGVGGVDMTLDGGTTWQPITLTASYARINITQLALTNPNVGFRIQTSGDSIAVDFGMVYPPNNVAVPLPVDYAITVSGAGVTFISQSRPNIDKDDAGPLAAVIRAGPWAWFMQFRSERADGGAIFTGDVTSIASISAGGASWYGVTTAGNNFRLGLNQVNKAAGYLRGDGTMALCLNGGAVATGSGKAMATTLDHIDLMTNGSAGLSAYGICERWAMSPNMYFSDAALQAMTT